MKEKINANLDNYIFFPHPTNNYVTKKKLRFNFNLLSDGFISSAGLDCGVQKSFDVIS